MFIHENNQTFIYIYVDNIYLFKLNLNLLKLIKVKLNEYFKIINLKLSSHYLNTKVISSFNRINLNQIFYLLEV